MESARNLIIEMYGVKKRLSDVEKISFSIDTHLGFDRQTSFSNGCRQFILYDWGHIIFHTWPDKQIMTADVFTNFSEPRLSYIKKLIMEVFKPKNHICDEIIRITGFQSDE